MAIFSALLSASKPGTSPFCRRFQILSIPGITRGRLLPTHCWEGKEREEGRRCLPVSCHQALLQTFQPHHELPTARAPVKCVVQTKTLCSSRTNLLGLQRSIDLYDGRRPRTWRHIRRSNAACSKAMAGTDRPGDVCAYVVSPLFIRHTQRCSALQHRF
jgi:hypothetical protein